MEPRRVFRLLGYGSPVCYCSPPGLRGIDMVVAAARGDQDAKSVIDDHLTRFARTTRRTGLVDTLRRIAAGQADTSLLAGRDPLDSAILRAIFDQLGS